MQGVGAAVTSSNLLQTVYGFEPGRAGNRSRVGNPMADVFETKQGNLFLVPVVEAHFTAPVSALAGAGDRQRCVRQRR